MPPAARKRAPRKPKAPRLATAAGQGLGFSLQVTRLLARLLEDREPGDAVCLEAFSDVGLVKADGSTMAEETKSTHGYNPVSDRSVALWKTLANWLDAVKAGAIPQHNAKFVLYVSRPVPTGALALTLHEALERNGAVAALKSARRVLWGDEPNFPLRADLPKELREQTDRLWTTTSVSPKLFDIVKGFRIVFGSGSPTNDIRELMGRQLVSDDMLDHVTEWALGWVKRHTDQLLEKGVPAYLEYSTFREALLNFCRAHDRKDMLMALAGEPSPTEVDAERKLKTYVRQLELVAVDEEDILAAINDHLRAAVDRTQWAEKGYVDGAMITTFEGELRRTWKNHRDRTKIAHHSVEPEGQGQLLFRACEAHRAAVNGLNCPEYFTRGSFHALADRLKIGWHPLYESLLQLRKMP